LPIPYDVLRLIFTCCHPALHQEAQLALTLRTVAGLPTIEIARAPEAEDPERRFLEGRLREVRGTAIPRDR
jgi:RNA polymerase sigma-70 factor (ECF subfamily)